MKVYTLHGRCQSIGLATDLLPAKEIEERGLDPIGRLVILEISSDSGAGVPMSLAWAERLEITLAETAAEEPKP